MILVRAVQQPVSKVGCHPQVCLRVLLRPTRQHPQADLRVAPDFLDGLLSAQGVQV